MDYYGNNNWLDYIEHGWFGSSQKGSAKERKKRMKQAKKRYNKKMSATRRKIAVKKCMQTVARLMGKQMDFKKKPSDKTEKKAYRKAGWCKSMFIPGGLYAEGKVRWKAENVEI